MANRLGGTGKDSSTEFKVRDTRKMMPGAPGGRPGLNRAERRALKKEIRRAAREARPCRPHTRLATALRIVIAAASAASVVIWLAIYL
ncbi:hypothetical protein GCM10010401_01310 [Rarobacter faecitabidus]|uniref:Uncharacterized protein n=1 Tax=Rarobacter faecitabidus TaxID=13243 RepID=A0A542ZWM2_RARFA|nr:hypothetical protein [Rarobacter faecitabidus]TQL64732.1 hypothetical protein FB461_1243 [Rarobacter faecitabidus]